MQRRCKASPERLYDQILWSPPEPNALVSDAAKHFGPHRSQALASAPQLKQVEGLGKSVVPLISDSPVLELLGDAHGSGVRPGGSSASLVMRCRD